MNQNEARVKVLESIQDLKEYVLSLKPDVAPRSLDRLVDQELEELCCRALTLKDKEGRYLGYSHVDVFKSLKDKMKQIEQE